MISVVIVTYNNEPDLVEALSPLVRGSVEGLIRELIAADEGSTDKTLDILDEAGAVLAPRGIEAACEAAKGPWLLIIAPSTRLGPDWLRPVRRHLESGSERPAKLVRGGFFPRIEAVLTLKRDYRHGRVVGARRIRI